MTISIFSSSDEMKLESVAEPLMDRTGFRWLYYRNVIRVDSGLAELPWPLTPDTMLS